MSRVKSKAAARDVGAADAMLVPWRAMLVRGYSGSGCGLQGLQADDAPGAGDIRCEVDLNLPGHCR
jgi:hypothetical protein